jgi:hypothetical protein
MLMFLAHPILTLSGLQLALRAGVAAALALAIGQLIRTGEKPDEVG